VGIPQGELKLLDSDLLIVTSQKAFSSPRFPPALHISLKTGLPGLSRPGFTGTVGRS
jgi:hypothetical protein